MLTSLRNLSLKKLMILLIVIQSLYSLRVSLFIIIYQKSSSTQLFRNTQSNELRHESFHKVIKHTQSFKQYLKQPNESKIFNILKEDIDKTKTKMSFNVQTKI